MSLILQDTSKIFPDIRDSYIKKRGQENQAKSWIPPQKESRSLTLKGNIRDGQENNNQNEKRSRVMGLLSCPLLKR